MMPKINRRPSFGSTNPPSISPSNTKHHLRTKHMSRSKTPSRPEFHSYRHLSRSYGVLSRSKSVTFPINYSAPENVVGLTKALELSPIKLMGRAETTTPVLSVELGSELRLRIPRARRLEPSWKLLYSIDQHGVSIHTMYENLRNHQGPIILAIKDSEDTTFGAYLSEPFQPHPGFYGNGECFLWKRVNSDMIEPEIKVYPRSGENEYYMLSDLGFISVGSSDGKFGLWLNNQFDEGVTNKCTTFDNDPLTTSKFHCVEMEIWGI
ncbi:oxidation resistance protein 1, variant 2 [Basidiobolus ranarum]